MGQRLLCALTRLADRGDLLPSHIKLIESLEIGCTPNDWITFANQATPLDFGSLAPSVLDTRFSLSLSANIITEGYELEYLVHEFPKALRWRSLGAWPTFTRNILMLWVMKL